MGNLFDSVAPNFTATLRGPKLPERPSDQAIKLAQASYDGKEVDGETYHVIRHKFPTAKDAEDAADELKRAGSYTDPMSTVRVVIDPDNTGDTRTIAFNAGARRGRK